MCVQPLLKSNPMTRINPHQIVSQTSEDRKECKKRLNEWHIPVFNAFSKQPGRHLNNLPGFPEGAEYGIVPQNRYQRWLRQGMEEDDLVTAHYTDRFPSKSVEALANFYFVAWGFY